MSVDGHGRINGLPPSSQAQPPPASWFTALRTAEPGFSSVTNVAIDACELRSDALGSAGPHGIGRPIRVNVRTLTAPLTGVQRYVGELVKRLAPAVQPIAPGSTLGGLRGHLWDQLVLPGRVGSDLLWSPANLGPLAVDRQVVTVHDCSALEHPEWYSRRFAGLYGLIMPALARRCRRIIAVSHATRAAVIERCRVRPERVVVVHPGVDDRFRQAPTLPAVHHALRLPSPRYVLAVATVQPRKNLHRLMLAWTAALPRLASDVHLVLVGSAADAGIFASMTLPQAERVHLAGRVPDPIMPALYAQALFFALPSLYEGFGLPVLEAMASGCPVLTSDRTSLPELVGDAGLLVDPTDVGAIADGLVRLAGDASLRALLSERGLQRSAMFTWERAAAETLSVLREAA